jgi:uncharacterized lipoprotein YehR (DUF1307 family)
MSKNFNCSYMAMSSLTYILGFFVNTTVHKNLQIEQTEPLVKHQGLLKTWIICGGGMKFHKILDE